jgi:hypothetical protein
MEPHMDLEDDIIRRLVKLEQEVSKLVQEVAVIKSNYATKADVLEAKNSLIMWVVSALVLTQLLPFLLKKLGG